MNLIINTTATQYQDYDIKVELPDDISEDALNDILDKLEWKTEKNLDALLEELKLLGFTYIYDRKVKEDCGEDIIVNSVRLT